jgi:hypothetical protein
MTRRYKLVRLVDGFPQFIDYVGPKYGWSSDWSLAVQRVYQRAA